MMNTKCHKWKVIYQSDGYIRGLFTIRFARIYHLQCTICGFIIGEEMQLHCPHCNRRLNLK
jgi:hypothetical protein